MKKLSWLAIIGIFALTWADLAPAQQPTMSRWRDDPAAQAPKGPKGKGRAAPLFDPATVETVKGEVLRMEQFTPPKGGAPPMMRLELKTDKETVMVALGPADFIASRNIKLAAGDKLEIKGSRIKRPRHTVIVAVEVKKGDQTLKLRDDKGAPLWPLGRNR